MNADLIQPVYMNWFYSFAGLLFTVMAMFCLIGVFKRK